MQRFHHSQFSDARRLSELKLAAGQRVSVCIPTLNEAETIGPIVATIRAELVERVPLVDEMLVIDSNSTDGTCECARPCGSRSSPIRAHRPGNGNPHRQGRELVEGAAGLRGSIICYIDGDISNFHPGFVTGLIGPLLADPEIDYVKAYYERPLARGDSTHAAGGGRVSEILVRPMISLFYPELAGDPPAALRRIRGTTRPAGITPLPHRLWRGNRPPDRSRAGWRVRAHRPDRS